MITTYQPFPASSFFITPNQPSTSCRFGALPRPLTSPSLTTAGGEKSGLTVLFTETLLSLYPPIQDFTGQ